MAYNVRIMEKAEEDLSEIVDYISDMLKNQQPANNLLADFLKEKEISAFCCLRGRILCSYLA